MDKYKAYLLDKYKHKYEAQVKQAKIYFKKKKFYTKCECKRSNNVMNPIGFGCMFP